MCQVPEINVQFSTGRGPNAIAERQKRIQAMRSLYGLDPAPADSASQPPASPLQHSARPFFPTPPPPAPSMPQPAHELAPARVSFSPRKPDIEHFIPERRLLQSLDEVSQSNSHHLARFSSVPKTPQRTPRSAARNFTPRRRAHPQSPRSTFSTPWDNRSPSRQMLLASSQSRRSSLFSLENKPRNTPATTSLLMYAVIRSLEGKFDEEEVKVEL